MESSKITQIAEHLADESTRCTAVKRLGALALGAVAVASVGRSTAARDNPKNGNVDNECLNRCQRHSDNRCHERCRRTR